ncbi:hypothetical protein RQM59_01480 [Flavobacteriaceae bacterium S356]|uniref:Co-chaperone DjlA N-terminal domain-containing protein n=1 Tax=Asprobacillus argus TaxID=3076534 RepID=A0ABU3LC91_9FLAO|nr:hypothetical protein [Flavobacteriaceae bacterium S356]
MNPWTTCCHSFYCNVAKVFYAIAYIDGEIRDEEYTSFKEALKKEWVEKHKGRREVVDEIVARFEALKKEKRIAVDCFQEFVAYKKEHEKLFTNPMRSTIWELACSIADVVNKKNKSELILLAHLGRHLGLIKPRVQ